MPARYNFECYEGEFIPHACKELFLGIICERRNIQGGKKVTKEDYTTNQVKHFKQITERMSGLYDEKNRRYGNSFSKSIDEWGMIVSAMRLDEKVARFKQLVKNPADCGDESMYDTLIDIANYAVMTLMELEKRGVSSACNQAAKSKNA